jgi:hypothetical protein
MVAKYRSCFGSRMSQVQILPPRPVKTIGYREICGLFLCQNVAGYKTGYNKKADAFTPAPGF